MAFSERSGLKRLLCVHTKEKLYACELCKKAYSDRGSLRKHLRAHTKEKPYVFKICNKALSQRMPSRHEGTLKSRRAASPLGRMGGGEERWETPNHPQGVLPLNWGETELNRSVTCMVIKATPNDKRHLAFCHDEFHGP
ncbi:uncharacterized protein TNCV_138271 [Trichonephila clavipes]|nr:uncharacterized protein TNCV_138271 [Trichonephila clavipes]